jgi:hypothetical protein
MRYSVFFLTTTDETIKSAQSRRANISIKRKYVNIEMIKRIPYDQITNVSVEHDVSDAPLSAGKALGGAIIAGPLGAIVGASMGGKKVSSMITLEYTGDNGQTKQITLEAKLAAALKAKIDKNRQALQLSTPGTTVQHGTKTAQGSLRRGLLIYFTWPYQLYKKFQNSQNKHRLQ